MQLSINPKTPLLVIEDDPVHFSSIEEAFGGSLYVLHRPESISEDVLLNYKSVHDVQLIIVDLNLSLFGSSLEDMGLDIIYRYLWPADRSAYFVIFTQYPEKWKKRGGRHPHPNWQFVEKVIDGVTNKLSTSCLAELRSAVNAFRPFCMPAIETPHFSQRSILDELDSFLPQKAKPRDRGLLARCSVVLGESVSRSVDVLNECVLASEPFRRTGMLSGDIAIAVYGSYGRLEARSKSDIEFSVLYDGGVSPGDLKNLAVQCWNRMMTFMESRKWIYEGREAIRKSKPPLLKLSSALDDLRNGYRPLLPIESIIEADIAKDPQVRDRYIQILTETRAVFNPQLLLRLKQKLLFAPRKEAVMNFQRTVQGSRLRECLDQFFMDTRPESISTTKDWKKIVLRLLNVMAIRLFVADYVVSHGEKFFTDADWTQFFDRLATPGLFKVAYLWPRCMHDFDLLVKDVRTVTSFLSEYVQAFEHLVHFEDSPSSNTVEWESQLQRHVRDCIECYSKVVGIIEKRWRGESKSQPKWILDMKGLEEFTERFLG